MTIQVKSPNSTFIHIPKNAGTSISHWLIAYKKATWSYKNHYGGKHFTLEKIKRVDQNDLGFTFMCVRNPWERMVSGYFYYQKQRKFHNRTFKEFIHQSNWHTLNTMQCDYGPVDCILRFENLEKDFKQIQDFYGVYSPLTKENRSKHNAYRQYYDTELREIVAERCKRDIETFGYEF